MRKSAREIIYDLETRIEKLEKQAVFGWIKDQYKEHKRNKRLMEEERLRFESLSPEEQQKELNRKKKMEKERARREQEELEREYEAEAMEDAIETMTKSFKEFMDKLQYGIYEWAEETNYRLDSKGNIKGSFDFGGNEYKISTNFDDELISLSSNWDNYKRGKFFGDANVELKIKGFSFDKTYRLHIGYYVRGWSHTNVTYVESRTYSYGVDGLIRRINNDLEKALGYW